MSILEEEVAEAFDTMDWEQDAPSRAFDELVNQRARQIRVEREARRRVDAEEAPERQPIDLATLAQVLERPQPPRDRIAGLAPWEASTLITAQRKVGKTTLVGNLARCLFTGDRFLGRFDVQPLDGAIAFLNYEVSAQQLARWLDELDVDRERLVQVNLRGRSNPLRDPEDRAELARALRARGVEALIVDPFSRAFVGDSQNDAGQVTSFLTDLDTFTRAEVGALDLFLTNHAGWDAERSRGSTALEDWADSLWRIVRPEADDSARYFSAFGRDVDVEEDRLSFDERTRTLTLTGTGSRKNAAAADRMDILKGCAVATVKAAPGLNTSEIERRLKTDGQRFQKGDVSKALATAAEEGLLTFTMGPRNAKEWHLPRHTPTHPGGVTLTYPDPLLVGGRSTGVAQDPVTPDALLADPEASEAGEC